MEHTMKFTYLIGLLVFVSSTVLAGLVQHVPVLVTLYPDGSGDVRGDMLTARYSDNDVEYIGCGVRQYLNGSSTPFSFGFCQATDSEGVEAFCSTENKELLSTMNASSAYSFILFSFNDFGECTHIGFSTQSFYIPDRVQKSKKSKKSKK
jgi:hypothetical protein